MKDYLQNRRWSADLNTRKGTGFSLDRVKQVFDGLPVCNRSGRRVKKMSFLGLMAFGLPAPSRVNHDLLHIRRRASVQWRNHPIVIAKNTTLSCLGHKDKRNSKDSLFESYALSLPSWGPFFFPGWPLEAQRLTNNYTRSFLNR